MQKSVAFLYGLALTLAFTALGCMGRTSEVRAASPGDLGQIRGQAIPAVYFVPFDTSSVELKGDHGDAATAQSNKQKWFTHLVAGAQLAMDQGTMNSQTVVVAPANPYSAEVMDKLKVRLTYAPAPPPTSYVVTGRYVVSDNVGGGSRALVGAMAGKTYTRADIRIQRDDKLIFLATLDGKYLGGGFSWGYETLGANEALGRSIVELIQKLQAGIPIEGAGPAVMQASAAPPPAAAPPTAPTSTPTSISTPPPSGAECFPHCRTGYVCSQGRCVPPQPAAPAATAGCFPPCRSGFICSQDKCVSSCNPPCAAGEKCTAMGECVIGGASAPAR